MKTILIAQISLELSPVVRARVSDETVEEYAELYRAGKSLPEPDVFIDEAGEILLADGRHRIDAAQAAGLDSIKCEVHEGGYAEALKFALEANTQHGLRRTNADKRACAAAALKEWPKLSNRQLAELCGMNDTTVASVRIEMEARKVIASTPVRTGSDGRQFPCAGKTDINTNPLKTKEIKNMAARFMPGGEVDFNPPPPPPSETTAVGKTPISISAWNEFHAICNYVDKLQHRQDGRYVTPEFCHLVTLLDKFKRHVQITMVNVLDEALSTKPGVTAADIYAAYPLKVGKPVAIRAIEKQMKTTAPEKLLERTKLFAKTRGGDLDKCPHPSTWFNQERFNDDPKTWKPSPVLKNGKPPEREGFCSL